MTLEFNYSKDLFAHKPHWAPQPMEINQLYQILIYYITLFHISKHPSTLFFIVNHSILEVKYNVRESEPETTEEIVEKQC